MTKVFLEDVTDGSTDPGLGKIEVGFLKGNGIDRMVLKIETKLVEGGKTVCRGQTVDMIGPTAKRIRGRLAKMIAGREVGNRVERRRKRQIGRKCGGGRGG
jgi:hypothetical protein